MRALVLVPTRELATQVGLVFETLCRGARFPLTVRVVHGGSSINPQMLALRGGADILVATPGRLIDLSSRNAARLGSVEFLVLDEADKMLDLGFRDELAAIMSLVPENRQSLLFSATFPAELEAVAAAALRESERVALDLPAESGANGGNEKLGEIKASRASDSVAAAPGAAIEELVYLVARDDKGPFLRRLISTDPRFERVLVFASSTRRADNVARKLVNNGIAAAAFHGGLSQAARTKALSDFRGGAVRALVASDLASRGLDIEGLPCVVNYELPRAPIDYVHRIGRTGRAGARGLAVSLISPDEEAHLRLIEKRVGRKIARREA